MWNLSYCNSPCNNYEKFRIHRDHLKRLFSVKSTINQSNSFHFSQPRFKLLKTQTEMNIQKTIANDNTILFNRMLDIANKPSPYNRIISQPSYCPVFDTSTINWLKKRKKTKLKKENALLRKRFLYSKSFYSTKSFELENDYYRYLERNMSQKVINPNLYFYPFSTYKKNISNEQNAVTPSRISLSRARVTTFKPKCLILSTSNKLTSSSMKNIKTYSAISNKTTGTHTITGKE